MYKWSWTPKEDKKLRELRFKGKLFFEIGREMNVRAKNAEIRIIHLAYLELPENYKMRHVSETANLYKISQDNLKAYADYRTSEKTLAVRTNSTGD